MAITCWQCGKLLPQWQAVATILLLVLPSGYCTAAVVQQVVLQLVLLPAPWKCCVTK
jgi:hypothetical protein